MASISLKMTPTEAKAEGYGAPPEIKPPEFTWGSSISLTPEQTKGLFPGGIPQVKTVLKLDVSAIVDGLNVDRQDTSKVAVDLQFTDIAIETEPDRDLNYYGDAGPKK